MNTASWPESSHDEMEARITAHLSAAGFPQSYVCFSMYETTVDPVKDDLSDWRVKCPDFGARFADGPVRFASWSLDDYRILSEPYINPTWGDVLVEAERSCRARGAPELDHIFLESIDDETGEKTPDGARVYEMFFGS